MPAIFRVWAACLGLLTACYSAPKPDCGFVCGPGGECPADYHCATDGHCHADSSPASVMCGIDAGIDARIVDAFFADADLIHPTVVGTSPMDTMTNVPVDTTIEVDFSEQVYYVDSTTFTVMVGVNAIPGNISPASTSIYVFTPTVPFQNNVQVDVTLTTGIIDGSGNQLDQPYNFKFFTAP